MAIETTVLTKLRRLPEAQQQEVLHFVEFLEAKMQPATGNKRAHLATAAQALLADYENDDLTAFKTLDGEDFHVYRHWRSC